MSPDIGGITGRLKLVVGDGEIDLGSIYLPLTVTRVSPEKVPYMHLGIGVDLEQVRTVIADLFALAETSAAATTADSHHGRSPNGLVQGR